MQEIESSAPRMESGPRPRVRDAATLVVLDRSGPEIRILVGRRSAGHVFMAGKLVFPGGRIDRSDLALADRFMLEPTVLQRLMAGTTGRFSQKRAVALALAAIRETYEETGLMIGRQGDFASSAPFWQDFAARGIVPDPAALFPFARAITPPMRVRRYDTRFLAVEATAIAHAAPFEERPTDEFDTVAWMTLDEMMAEDLAGITRLALEDLRTRLGEGTLMDAACPVPFYRQVNRRHVRGLI